MNKKLIVYLGGVCGASKWRDDFLQMLDLDKIEPINPVVKSWKWDKNQREELEKTCDVLVYVLSPLLSGYTSIASLVDFSNDCTSKVLLCVLSEDQGKTFSSHQQQSVQSVVDIVSDNGCKVFNSLQELAKHVNTLAKQKN